MAWTPLVSSNVAAIDYDPNAQILSVRFHSGSQYNFSDVPQEVYDNFLEAPSPGRYFNAAVKNTYSEA